MMTGSLARRCVLGLGGLAVAAAVFSYAVRTHLASACFEQDTPYLPLCGDPPDEADMRQKEMRQRLARDPGDARAWTRLLTSTQPPQSDAILPGAVMTAPHDPNVVRWGAAHDLQAGRMAAGVGKLVEILQYRTSPEAAKVLSQVAAQPGSLALMQPYYATAAQWMPQLVADSDALENNTPGDLLPLVAATQDSLPASTRRRYMVALRIAGLWADAYGLWVSYHKEPVPVFYNPSFDQPIQSDGFDWELTKASRSRAGALFEQASVARRGLVLDIEFTGRGFRSPVMRQYLFLAPGTYRVQGDYRALKLLSEGLAWTVQCTAGSMPVLGSSEPLRETGGAWKRFEFEFTVPADCGPMASLQLDPLNASEATSGFTGYVSFDAFSLARSVFSQ